MTATLLHCAACCLRLMSQFAAAAVCWKVLESRGSRSVSLPVLPPRHYRVSESLWLKRGKSNPCELGRRCMLARVKKSLNSVVGCSINDGYKGLPTPPRCPRYRYQHQQVCSSAQGLPVRAPAAVLGQGQKIRARLERGRRSRSSIGKPTLQCGLWLAKGLTSSSTCSGSILKDRTELGLGPLWQSCRHDFSLREASPQGPGKHRASWMM